MVAQLSFDFEYITLVKKTPKKVLKKTPKRVRYIVPTYIKFYTIYQYDRQKFRKILNEWLKTPEGKNRTVEALKAKQDEILKECFIRDDNGKPLRDSDEEHIFRYSSLQYIKKNEDDVNPAGIYEQIYNYCGISPFEKRSKINRKGLCIYPQDQQAELENTWQLTLKDRVKLHIELLRLLREGFSIKEAVCKVKSRLIKID